MLSSRRVRLGGAAHVLWQGGLWRGVHGRGFPLGAFVRTRLPLDDTAFADLSLPRPVCFLSHHLSGTAPYLVSLRVVVVVIAPLQRAVPFLVLPPHAGSANSSCLCSSESHHRWASFKQRRPHLSDHFAEHFEGVVPSPGSLLEVATASGLPTQLACTPSALTTGSSQASHPLSRTSSSVSFASPSSLASRFLRQSRWSSCHVLPPRTSRRGKSWGASGLPC